MPDKPYARNKGMAVMTPDEVALWDMHDELSRLFVGLENSIIDCARGKYEGTHLTADALNRMKEIFAIILADYAELYHRTPAHRRPKFWRPPDWQNDL